MTSSIPFPDADDAADATAPAADAAAPTDAASTDTASTDAAPEDAAPEDAPPAAAPAASIHQLIRLHSRERLIVHPLKWTHRHLELLQCLFEEPTEEAAAIGVDAPPVVHVAPYVGPVRALAEKQSEEAYTWRELQVAWLLAADAHYTIRFE